MSVGEWCAELQLQDSGVPCGHREDCDVLPLEWDLPLTYFVLLTFMPPQYSPWERAGNFGVDMHSVL